MVQLVIKNISKKFGDLIAVDNVSFDLNHGDLAVILGPSGCGKTTLLKLIAGILEPDKGSILFEKKLMNDVIAQDRNVGYVPQNLALFPHLTVSKNIQFGLDARHWSIQRKKERLNYLVELGGLQGLESRLPSHISGGQQQRCAILRALAPEPGVLLLDEPLSSLDTQLKNKVKWNLRLIQQETETTTLFVTHDQTDAREIADFLIFMDRGKIIQKDTLQNIMKNVESFSVASILGFPNLLEVLEILKGNNEFKLKTKIGNILIKDLESFTNQKLIGIGIEPSKITIDEVIPQNEDKSDLSINQFLARIMSIEEQGKNRILNLELANTIIKVYESAENSRFELQIGKKVKFTIQKESIRFFII